MVKINQLIFGIIFLMAIMPIASATISDFGYHQENTNITLYQVCTNCTYINMTLISPSSAILVSDVAMIADAYQYTYVVDGNNLSEIGQYKVHGLGDDGGTETFWSYTFDVTKTGYNSANTDFMILIFALFGVIVILLIMAAVLHQEHALLAIIFAGIGFYLLNPVIQTANMAVENNYFDAGMSGMISTIEQLLTWMSYAVMVYIIVYIFVKAISNYNSEKQLKMEGLR